MADILIIGLCTIMCKGEDFTDMEDFGSQKQLNDGWEVKERETNKPPRGRKKQKCLSRSRGAFDENVGKNVIQLKIGDSQAVLFAILLTGSEAGELNPIAHQIPNRQDIFIVLNK